MNPSAPASSSSHRNLLWLIFGALMLIAGIQAYPLSPSLEKAIGGGSLAVAGLIFLVRLISPILDLAFRDIPSPLTDRTNSNR